MPSACGPGSHARTAVYPYRSPTCARPSRQKSYDRPTIVEETRCLLNRCRRHGERDAREPTPPGSVPVWCEKAAEGGESKTRAGLWSAQMMSATSSDNTGSSASERPCIANGDKPARRAAWRGILPRHVQDLAQIRGVRGDRLSPLTPNRLTFADSGLNSHWARAHAHQNITAM